MQRRTIAIVMTVLAAAMISWGCLGRGRRLSHEERVFRRHETQAYGHLKAERYEAAITEFEAQRAMAPENPEPLYGLACAHARKGDKEKALDWLAKAEGSGFIYAARARKDDDLSSLRDEERFKAITGKMEETWKGQEERWRAVHHDLDSRTAPAYSSLRALQRDFAERLRARDRDRWRRNFLVHEEERWRLLDEKMAALRRFIADHPGDRRLDDAGLALVETMHEYRPALFVATWDQDGPVAVDVCDWFLKTFPESPHVRRVFYLRAIAHWLSRPTPKDKDEKPFSPEDLETAHREFDAVVPGYPGTYEAGKALVWRASIAFGAADEELTPEVKELHARLIREYGHNHRVMRYARWWARGLLFRFRSLEGFEGTDLSGKVWNLAAMKGRVVLLDFWATWCGPCVEEIPGLKDAYAKYHDRGFEIIGVSLDERRKDLVQYVEKNKVVWPQIYEGGGFHTKLARRFDVSGIPFTVLLDREGNIAAVDVHGARTAETIARVLGVAPGAPAAESANRPGGRGL